MISSRISLKINEIIEHAKQLESVGKYQEAVDFLSPYWKNPKEFPDVSGLSKEIQAEILLRCGSLASNLGSCKQTQNSQEFARKMLSQARELFTALENQEKISDCEAHIATTHLRTGELSESQGWVRRALEHNLKENGEVRLYTYITEGLILLSEKRFVALVNKCEKLERLFQSSAFDVLQGTFNNIFAIALMRSGDKEYALKRFESAKLSYQQSKHYLYLAGLENNLAGFYEIEGRYDDAHKSVVSAIENYKKLSDKTHEGYSVDTRAHIFMSEGKYEDALVCANEAVKMLEDGENYCYYANSMQTKSHIEYHLNDYEASLETMIASVNIAAIHVSQTQAKKFVKDYAELQKTFNQK